MPAYAAVTHAGAMRAPSDLFRPTPLSVVGMTAAVALCWFTGLETRGYRLSIGDGPYRGDYLLATGTGLAVATVLALGLVALAVLRAPRWLLVATAATTAHHVILAELAYQRAAAAPVDRPYPYGSVGDGLTEALMPGSWPLLAVVLTAVVAVLRPPRVRAARPLGRIARAGLAVAFLLASLTGVVAWWFSVDFIFEGEPDRSDYRTAIVCAAGTALLLLLAVAVVRLRWRAWSPVWAATLGVLVQSFVVLSCLGGATAAPDPGSAAPDPVQIRFCLEAVALIPTSWPLVAVVVLAVVTAAQSLRGPASGPGRATTVRTSSPLSQHAKTATSRAPTVRTRRLRDGWAVGSTWSPYQGRTAGAATERR